MIRQWIKYAELFLSSQLTLTNQVSKFKIFERPGILNEKSENQFSIHYILNINKYVCAILLVNNNREKVD